MEQFKRYGIITLIGITLFGVMYSSVELLDWQFFPYLQICLLSLLTLIIATLNYFHKESSSPSFIYTTWAMIGFEWLVCLILFNQADLIMDYFQLIFLPLVYYVYIALFQLLKNRSPSIQKRGRVVFYFLIPSTLTFFVAPNTWSAIGMEVLFCLYLAAILISKPISSQE
jgi:hypothetical protein